MNDADEEQQESRRRACWLDFTNAAEMAARGDYGAASRLVERYPSVRAELWAFARALAAGRIVAKGGRFYPVESRGGICEDSAGAEVPAPSQGIPF